jgi:formylglycine-generating enzyme required for sulfatase activity
MLKPTGFWSYSSSDDEAAGGRLSQLRALLARELQLKIGSRPKVHIFQDVSAIPPGARWEKQIREAINDSSFLIPIVTPAYLQSEWCYREMTLFQTRQNLLGRDNLIFPLHYIDVRMLEPTDCYNDKFLDVLRECQWSDFCELRLKGPESEDVLRKLGAVANAIRDSLRAPAPVSAAPLQEPEQETPPPPPKHVPLLNGKPQPKSQTRRTEPPRQAEGRFIQDFDGAPKLVRIAPGRFWMGSPEDELGRSIDESPRHEVELASSFAVGAFPVTFSEWAAAQADYGVDHAPNDDGWGISNRPVINVSWDDVQKYLSWLSGKSGERYRLPTEAEWEYVARAGTDTPFWWGSVISSNQANYDGRYVYAGGAKGEYSGRTLPVDKFDPNPWGLYQVHGNVWEWCQDNWIADYEQAPRNGIARTTPPPPRSILPKLPLRVVRGGSWSTMPKDLRCARRFHFPQNYRGNSIGFRVVREL